MNTAVQGWEEAGAISRAVALLRQGKIVALPTETVYGLAADALNASAVARIFETKQRPRFNPLIVHLPGLDWLKRVAQLAERDRPLIETLVERFWPGPLTLVLPRRPLIADIVTAGLETVAVRMSAHPAFAAVCGELGSPLAAPSANRFGRISPTTAQHVVEEFGDTLPLIIDAGPTTHGLESTIASVRDGKIGVLRRGPITAEQLSQYGPAECVMTQAVTAPGQLPAHYAPRTPFRLIGKAGDFCPPDDKRVGLLAWESSVAPTYVAVRLLSGRQDPAEAAANLFRQLRELDALGLDLIVAEEVPEEGLGAAIMDRLRRAAHGSETGD